MAANPSSVAALSYGSFDPVLYTPDYSFLKYVLDKKTDSYQTGLKSVANNYGVLNKELTSSVNRARRDEYIQNASVQLKKIAGSDLSLQENVNAANNIFTPMATDPAFLYDSYYTQFNKKQMQQMDAWKNSDDPETRKRYNPEIYEWVNRDLDSLRKDTTGDPSSYNVKGRQAFGYVDPQSLINQAAKDSGFQVKKDVLGQPYIYSVEGGPDFKVNYQNFAQQVLASSPLYQQQNAILGENQKEKIVEQAKSNPLYSNMTNDQIYATFADQRYTTLKNNEKEYLEQVDKSIAQDKSDLTAYIKLNMDKGDDPNVVDYVTKRKAALDGQIERRKDLQTQYEDMYGADDDQSKLKRQKFVTQFTSDPTSYFSDLYAKNDITRFSNIRSTITSSTIKPDQTYIAEVQAKNNALRTLNDIKDDQHDNLVDDAGLLIKQEELDLKAKQLEAKNKLSGKGTKNADGSTTQPEIQFIDNSATQVVTSSILNTLKDNVVNTSNQALNNMTGTFGGFYLLESMGLKPEQVSAMRSMFTDYFNADSTAKPKTTKEQEGILNQAYNTIFSYAKESGNEELLNKLRPLYGTTLSIGQFPDLIKSSAKSYPVKTDNDMTAITEANEYQKNMDMVTKLSNDLNKGKQLIIAAKEGDKEFEGMFIKRADGTKDIINAEDIASRIPAKGWHQDIDWAVDPEVALSSTDIKNIAQGYIDGSVKVKKVTVKNNDNIFADGPRYIIQYNGHDLYMPLQDTNKDMFPYETSKFQRLTQQINEQVKIPLYNDGDNNLVKGSPFYKLSGDTKERVISTIQNVTTTNSNIYENADGTSAATQAEDQLPIRNALADKTNVADVELYTSSPINGGGQAVKVTFKDFGDKKKVPDWSGKSYFFPISVTPGSADVFQVFNNANHQSTFQKYIDNGKTYNMDDFEASGVKATIVPDQKGSQTGKIYLYQKAYDPTLKKFSDDFSPYGESMPYNLNRITFEELEANVRSQFLYPYVKQRIDFNKQKQITSTSVNALQTILNKL